MQYKKIEALQNDVIDNFVADNNIFAVFDSPVNVLFTDNFITNIEKMKDIFKQNSLTENIFFSCKCNKSFAFMSVATDQGCGIEVSSKYELKDALKYTNKIIASGPGKDDEYLGLSIDNNVIISVDDIEELKSIIKMGKGATILLRCSSNWIGIPSRFGIQKKEICECLKLINDNKINLLGFSFHIILISRIQFRFYQIISIKPLLRQIINIAISHYNISITSFFHILNSINAYTAIIHQNSSWFNTNFNVTQIFSNLMQNSI